MILYCALLCKKAYSEEATQVGDHAFVVENTAGATYIAFAGTKNLDNVLEDACCWPSKSPSGTFVHDGVMDAFNCLVQAVEPHIPKDRNVYFVGHSLGGGIAQIFAETYGCKVVTFGSLKTYFKLSFPKIDHTRIIIQGDPVPLLLLMYKHVGSTIEIVDDDGYPVDIPDHYIDHYIEWIQKGDFNGL